VTSVPPQASGVAHAAGGPSASRSGRVAAVVLGALGILLALLLVRLVWQLSQPRVDAQTLSFSVVDDARTDVRFEVTAPASSRVECEARAQASDAIDVGGATTVIAAGAEDRRQVILPVPTRRRAASAQVVSCRLLP
jgi:hypothetical protein